MNLLASANFAVREDEHTITKPPIGQGSRPAAAGSTNRFPDLISTSHQASSAML